MKKKLIVIVIMLIGIININAATIQGSEFTYQGELKDSAQNPLTGLYDFQFILFEEASATTIITNGIDDADITLENIQVTNGIFTILLDFPIPVFLGDQVWMQIHVKLNGSADPFTLLSPLQQITSTPYATHAASALVAAESISLSYPTNPTMIVGHQTPGCTDMGGPQYYTTIQFPIIFDAPPFFQMTIDETLNNNGASRSHLYKWDRNEVSIRCNNITDGGFWLGIDFGSHIISGKKVIVGREINVINGQTISFGESFTSPPVILLYPDDSFGINNSSDLQVRIINTVTTDGFEVFTNANLEGLHWLAMESGEYTHGQYHWSAGIGNNASNGASFDFDTITPGMTFTTRPKIMTSIQDTNNSGGTQTRVSQVDRDGFSIWINSASELMHFVAIEDLH